MERRITGDLEWPSEIPEPKITIDKIELILSELELKFNDSGKKNILGALRLYKIEEYNEKHTPVKNEKRGDIKDLLAEAERFGNKLFSWTRHDPSPEINNAYMAVSVVIEFLSLRLDLMKIKGRGQDGGAPPKLALMSLVQRLIVIYKAETGQQFTLEPATAYGRERKKNNPVAIKYLLKIVGLIDPGQAADAEKIIKQIKKKKYRPDIDLS